MIPAPVFLPGKVIAEKAAVGFLGKAGVERHKFGIVPFHTADIARLLVFAGDLGVLHHICHLVGDYLPPKAAVKWDRIGVQKRKGAVLFPHSCEALYHKPLHDAVTRVFGVGAYAGDKPHGILCAVDIHIQRIYRKLGNKVVLIKAAQHVCPLQHGEF